DNDGWLDLFRCCEHQPNRLFHNKGDGTFEEVSESAGLQSTGQEFCKGATWIDIDNDDDPDLFINNLAGTGQLYLNNGDGTFTLINSEMGIDGPKIGFPCGAWAFDNDGWLDIWATCYDRTVADIVRGMIGQPHKSQSNRLYRNMQGKGFRDIAKA